MYIKTDRQKLRVLILTATLCFVFTATLEAENRRSSRFKTRGNSYRDDSRWLRQLRDLERRHFRFYNNQFKLTRLHQGFSAINIKRLTGFQRDVNLLNRRLNRSSRLNPRTLEKFNQLNSRRFARVVKRLNTQKLAGDISRLKINKGVIDPHRLLKTNLNYDRINRNLARYQQRVLKALDRLDALRRKMESAPLRLK